MSSSPSAPLPINLSQANRKPKGGLARMKQDALLSERSKSHTRALAAAEQHQLAHEAVLAAADAEAAAITAWTHRDRDVAFAEPTADDIMFVEKHTADEESAAPEQQQQEQPKKAEAPAAGAALELDVLSAMSPPRCPSRLRSRVGRCACWRLCRCAAGRYCVLAPHGLPVSPLTRPHLTLGTSMPHPCAG